MSNQNASAADARIEHDSLGELAVPASALWGAQTQRAVENFRVSGRTMPARFLTALRNVVHVFGGEAARPVAARRDDRTCDHDQAWARYDSLRDGLLETDVGISGAFGSQATQSVVTSASCVASFRWGFWRTRS